MPTAATETSDLAPDDLDRTLKESGRSAMIDRLIATLDDRGAFRALLDALLLKARLELGLPAIQDGPLGDLPEPVRTRYENRYIEAIRTVGSKLLARGDLLAAWPYFRAIGEREPIAQALENNVPEPDDEQIPALIDIAFQQGAHPRRGFELILNHYGICSAISSFDHLPPDEAIRIHCAGRLVAHLHEHLVHALRSEIERRGQTLPPDGTPIAGLIAGRPWLFADDAYHVDVSHLASVVRISPILTNPTDLDRAVQLTDYGRNLGQIHRYAGEPPFELLYEDHAVYLRALLGQGVDAAIRHFRSKLPTHDPQAVAADRDPDETLPAQALVRLLVRLGRLDEAIDVAVDHLSGIPESLLTCPSVAALCQRAGRPDRLARVARDRGDLVQYATALAAGDPN